MAKNNMDYVNITSKTIMTADTIKNISQLLQYNFEYGYDNKFINVTKIIEQYEKNGILNIDFANYNEVFSDPCCGKVKTLKITNNKFLNNVIFVAENAKFSMI